MTAKTARSVAVLCLLSSVACTGPLAHTYWWPNTIAGQTEKAHMSLYFSGKNTFSGYGACNNFKGRYRYDENGDFQISELAIEEKVCEPEKMAAEERFMRTLRTARHLAIENGVLILRDEGSQPLAELGKAEVIIVG